MRTDRGELTRRGRMGVGAGLALLGMGVGLAAGWGLAGLAAGAVGLPALSFVLLERFPFRGVVVGGIAMLLGTATLSLQPGSVEIAWGDVAILGALLPMALVGDHWAGAMRAGMRRVSAPDPADGRWLTVTVDGQGPAPAAGKPAGLPKRPRNDPERRRLSRRVERNRVLVGSGVDA